MSAPEQDTNQSVFISYSTEDREAAHMIERFLEARGVEAWLDVETMQAGSSFLESIREAIGASRAVICLVSPSYASSRWCKTELGLALSVEKPVIPVRLHPSETSSMLNSLKDIDLSDLDQLNEDELSQRLDLLASWIDRITNSQQVVPV